jgi:hypothetical protein
VSAMWAILSAVTAVMLAVLGELVSEEIRARLDRIPFALLRAAAGRVPLAQRQELYDEAWLPELYHILRGDEAMPITRLVHGTRYALRIWLSAARIANELDPNPARRSLFKKAVQGLPSVTDRTLPYVLGCPLIGFFVGEALKGISWKDVLGIFASVIVLYILRALVRYWCPEPDCCPMGHRRGKIGTLARSLIIPGGAVCTILNLIQPMIGSDSWSAPISRASTVSVWLIVIAIPVGFRKLKLHIESQ